MNGKFVSKTNILAGAGIPCNITHNICEREQSCKYGMAATGVEFHAADHAIQSFRRRRRIMDLGTVDSAIENGYHGCNETDNHYQQRDGQ
ncbi:hypothetical protein PghCCS26_61360 [Paenibacillus glycanilyticus]|uniref:Uncharacterized protein n=1 Tax=Paenibacillus glycanilyticus TaxID=126569 RepID=A0ABQ6NV86_9BACL|nr:hypothetical protein PghCCS26_61360 [Paenibacillus glycanilyticus]